MIRFRAAFGQLFRGVEKVLRIEPAFDCLHRGPPARLFQAPNSSCLDWPMPWSALKDPVNSPSNAPAKAVVSLSGY